MKKKRVVVLISNIGTGTNLQAIIDGVNDKKINAEIVGIISDTSDSQALNRVKKYKLPIKIVPKKEELLKTLQTLNPDYICLAGWKQIILDEVIDAYAFRILNTHPGLIPDTLDGIVKNPDGTKAEWNKGKMTEKAMQNFFDKGATFAGCSNHFLSNEFDFGVVLGRVFEKIKSSDTVNSLYKRLKVKENKLYVEVLEKLTEEKKLNGKLKILITDGGGRGAALVDKYSKSKRISKIFVVPGNDLMQLNSKVPVKTFPHLKTTSLNEIAQIVRDEKIDLVDVSQDNAVEVGLVNLLTALNINVVGPTRESGQLEWDKSWSREFMSKYKIPSPKYFSFNNIDDAKDFLKKEKNRLWFIKASGLAEGKGVIPAKDNQEAIEKVEEMKKFGKAGETFLIEEGLVGEEFSAFALCSGKDFVYVGSAQDHKRVFDGDHGSNTGGMGCVSNPLVVDENIKKQINEIFKKVIDGMQKEKRPYKGILYLGGMVVKGKVFIIEFNARWGDPEAEVIIPSIKNDFVDVGLAIINGNIKNIKLELDNKVRVAVALCAKGYPTDYSKVKGKKILGIEKAIKSGVIIYGAGVKKAGKDYVVNGGRVLYVVGDGKDVMEAREKAYKAIKLISIMGDNEHYRTDIGYRDVNRMKSLKFKIKN